MTRVERCAMRLRGDASHAELTAERVGLNKGGEFPCGDEEGPTATESSSIPQRSAGYIFVPREHRVLHLREQFVDLTPAAVLTAKLVE